MLKILFSCLVVFAATAYADFYNIEFSDWVGEAYPKGCRIKFNNIITTDRYLKGETSYDDKDGSIIFVDELLGSAGETKGTLNSWTYALNTDTNPDADLLFKWFTTDYSSGAGHLELRKRFRIKRQKCVITEV